MVFFKRKPEFKVTCFRACGQAFYTNFSGSLFPLIIVIGGFSLSNRWQSQLKTASFLEQLKSLLRHEGYFFLWVIDPENKFYYEIESSNRPINNVYFHPGNCTIIHLKKHRGALW